jgi:two-component system response regulator AtoC
MQRVLVVDDEENIRHLLLVILKKAGYEPTAVPGGAEALRLLGEQDFGVLISDLRMPGMDGRQLLRELVASDWPGYAVMMSAYGGDEVAIECMKEGAYDYFNKPFKADEVVLLLRKIAEREQLFRENERLRDELDARFRFDNIIGTSEPMRRIFATVGKIAPYKTTVLLTGESGTGKELLARAIHRNSARADKPFVPVNCGAIPENLQESEFFGHAKGAFTGAHKAKRGLFGEADGGTLFLDEMGEMPLTLQVKLLRVLESDELRPVGETVARSIDVRLVAATSRDLEERVAEGAFLERFNRKFGRSVTRIEPDAMKALLDFGWPGNVRELENAMERAMLLSEGEALDLDAFPEAVRANRGGRGRRRDDSDLSIKRRVPALEADLIRRALEQTGGNRTHACRLLDISHRALLYKMRDYGIEIPAKGG